MKIERVLLFIPPAFTSKDRMDINPVPPLGLGYLAAVLEQNGLHVKIVDCLMEGWGNRENISKETIRMGLPFDKIEEIIRDYRPDIVGVNSLFTRQRENAHRIFALAKGVNKGVVTIAGGAHPSAMPELVLQDPNVDYAVIGEGEDTFTALINVIEGRGGLTMLDGVGYRQDGQVKIISKTRFIDDLDRIPFPARHLLSMEKYFGLKSSHGDRRKRRFSPIITSRGCPAKCSFCSAYAVWGRAFRSRSPDNIINELKHLKDKYGIEEIMFEDDNLTLDPERAEAIFDGMMKNGLNLEWDTPNGIAAWTLNENLIHKMKKSGCRTLNFAIESGNQHVLNDIIKKPLNLAKIKPLVRYAKKIGLNVGIFLVIGMPNETEEQMWDSFRLAEELGVFTPHISMATPYPGSELYDICKEKKYLRPDFSLDDLYIRSFAISTRECDGRRLKKILADGERYLLAAFIKNNPVVFLKRCIYKLFMDPAYFIRKAVGFLFPKNTEK